MTESGCRSIIKIVQTNRIAEYIGIAYVIIREEYCRRGCVKTLTYYASCYVIGDEKPWMEVLREIKYKKDTQSNTEMRYQCSHGNTRSGDTKASYLALKKHKNLLATVANINNRKKISLSKKQK